MKCSVWSLPVWPRGMSCSAYMERPGNSCPVVPSGAFTPPGACVVTARLPERMPIRRPEALLSRRMPRAARNAPDGTTGQDDLVFSYKPETHAAWRQPDNDNEHFLRPRLSGYRDPAVSDIEILTPISGRFQCVIDPPFKLPIQPNGRHDPQRAKPGS